MRQSIVERAEVESTIEQKPVVIELHYLEGADRPWIVRAPDGPSRAFKMEHAARRIYAAQVANHTRSYAGWI